MKEQDPAHRRPPRLLLVSYGSAGDQTTHTLPEPPPRTTVVYTCRTPAQLPTFSVCSPAYLVTPGPSPKSPLPIFILSVSTAAQQQVSEAPQVSHASVLHLSLPDCPSQSACFHLRQFLGHFPSLGHTLLHDLSVLSFFLRIYLRKAV